MEKQLFISIVERYYPWISCLEKAAFQIHDDVNQKYDHVLPYGFHLKMVASFVSRYGYLVAESEADILILYAGAYLHDTIEDCEGVTERMLAELFSERVAGMVAQESEDKSRTWMERKSATIEHLRTAPQEVQMIALADKLSNMRDIDRDYPIDGEKLWERFRMKDKEIIGWYYKGVRDSLREAFTGVEAYEEYCRLVAKNFE